MLRLIRDAGLEFSIKNRENSYGVPYFETTIWEPGEQDLRFINSGYGCHPISRIALNRSILEAAQSRLVYIHGSRDDFAQEWRGFENFSDSKKSQIRDQRLKKLHQPSGSVKFSSIRGCDIKSDFVSKSLNYVLDALTRNNFTRLILHDLSCDVEGIKVVRTIIPRMENFTIANKKVGRRLLALSRSMREL